MARIGKLEKQNWVLWISLNVENWKVKNHGRFNCITFLKTLLRAFVFKIDFVFDIFVVSGQILASTSYLYLFDFRHLSGTMIRSTLTRGLNHP